MLVLLNELALNGLAVLVALLVLEVVLDTTSAVCVAVALLAVLVALVTPGWVVWVAVLQVDVVLAVLVALRLLHVSLRVVLLDDVLVVAVVVIVDTVAVVEVLVSLKASRFRFEGVHVQASRISFNCRDLRSCKYLDQRFSR